MMTRFSLLLIGVCLVWPTVASAQTFEFGMGGSQENPPVMTDGTGLCTVTLDASAMTVDVECTFMDLNSDPFAAHIHGFAAPGDNAGVIVPLTVMGDAMSGTITGGDATLTQAEVDGILDGMTYVNLHTNDHPGGEIRGQIVPEPATLSLLVLSGLAMMRRRRRS